MHRRFLRRLPAAGPVLLATVVLAGCGAGNETVSARAERSNMSESASPGATFNDADVSFVTEMIRHHQQAIEMAQIAEHRANNAQVKQLAARIKAAQEPEIATMSEWLRQWGQPVPSPSMDHGGHGGPGIMTDQEMRDLMSASGTNFDRMFLQMMIRHHQGAVEMANTEQQEGENPEAKQLAAKIASDQTAEIKEMQDLLAKLYAQAVA